MTTVTLCGSSRFAKNFVEAMQELSLRGILVFPMGTATGREEDNRQWSRAEKELLDLVHLAKIIKSDAILVLGDGYIGWSTSREILWAAMQGVPVIGEVQVERSRLNRWDGIAELLRICSANAVARGVSTGDSWNERIVTTARERLCFLAGLRP